jgi:hypothetical protein
VAVQELQHKAVCHFPFIVQMIEDGVVPESGPAFVHHLGLFLRIKILADFTHDAQNLTLPLQQRGGRLRRIATAFSSSRFLTWLCKATRRRNSSAGALFTIEVRAKIIDNRWHPSSCGTNSYS